MDSRSQSFFRLAMAAVAVVFIGSQSIQAQVSPGMFLKPWAQEPHWADTVDEPIFMDSGKTKGTEHDTDVIYYDSYGRIKLDQDNANPDFAIGYRVMTLELGSDHPELPGGATDINIGGAFRLGELAPDWDVHLLAGVGTATDNHFDNGDAVYGIGTLHAIRQVDPRSAWHVGITFDGNRTFLPDTPLPYAVYMRQASPELAYAVGVPASWLQWQVDQNL